MFQVNFYRNVKQLLFLQQGKICRDFMKCFYARGSRGWNQQYNPDNFHIQEELESVEEDFDQQMENPNLHEEVIREEERRRRKIKFKIIERKYFKKPQEVNLLTWDAKEQIRFLNSEFPSEWTVDRLAESFPISREGVVKLLKSKFVPRTVHEIIQHDEKVQNNWKAIKSKHDIKGGPIMNRYQALLNEGKVHTLTNAGGIASLPRPKIRGLLPVPKSKAPGPYESIVKGYCEKTTKEKEETKVSPTSDTELYSIHRNHSQKFLEGVTSAVIPKSLASSNDIHKSSEKSTGHEANFVDDRSSISRNDEVEGWEESDSKASQDLQSMLDASISENDEFLELSKRHPRRLKQTMREGLELRGNKSEDIPSQVETLQMQGTGKVLDVSNNHNSRNQNTSLKENVLPGSLDHELDSWEGPDEAVLDSLQYDTGTNTAYIYDEGKGYQHPFGKKGEVGHKIEIPKHMEGKGHLFKKGDSYYDEDGEFLFRIPGQQ